MNTTDEFGREYDERPWGSFTVLDDHESDHKAKRLVAGGIGVKTAVVTYFHLSRGPLSHFEHPREDSPTGDGAGAADHASRAVRALRR